MKFTDGYWSVQKDNGRRSMQPWNLQTAEERGFELTDLRPGDRTLRIAEPA